MSTQVKLTSWSRLVADLSLTLLALAVIAALAETFFLPGILTTWSLGTLAGNALGISASHPSQQETIVLTLQVGCDYCTRSAPLFREIIKRAARPRSPKSVVAVLPDPLEASRSYLESIGVRVSDIRQVPLRAMGIEGTPTLLVLTEKGRIRAVWHGEQPLSNSSTIFRVIFDEP
jgi:hypothetical protein